MDSRIRILHVEDDPNDGDLIKATLEAGGLEVTVKRVTTASEFTAALANETFDLVLSDHTLPDFDGTAALLIARAEAPDIPFILVSGTLGEEAAVEGVRAGATDYVLKQRLSRLAPSVSRALAEAQERTGRKQAEVALRQTEAQLRQAQKMEAVGRLAGGVAHDFNNLLTAIMGYSQLAQARLEPNAPMLGDIEEILRAAKRAASLTRQLLAFSRKQVFQPRVLNLSTLITEMDGMLRRIIGTDLDLYTSPAVGLGQVKADPGQIEQVVLNLVVNARDAMPTGGKLTIESSNVQLDRAYSGGVATIPPGSYVMLAVSDTGCGMDAETISHIFEPFFTTKESDKGTGLGLSIVHGILQQSGGHIEVLSQPGRGTTFKIYLPQVEERVEGAAPSAGAEPPPGGSETVLLVEDEDLVRRVASASLCSAGYSVIEASNRAEALQICEACERNEATIDLMLSDIIMPGMSIRELRQRLSLVQPEMKLLCMSGYSDEAIVHQGVIEPEIRFIQKPFTVTGLLHGVREVLDAPRRRAA